MSETPRTDARAHKWTDLSGEWVDAEVSRSIERDLADLTAIVGQIRCVMGDDQASDFWDFFMAHHRLISRLQTCSDELAELHDVAHEKWKEAWR